MCKVDNMDNFNGVSTKELHKKLQEFTGKSAYHLNTKLLKKYVLWFEQTKEQNVNLKYFYSLIDKTSKNTIKHNNYNFETGTKFIRSYKGIKYEVQVSEKWFIYNGKNYKSLSAIAKLITGTQWNGKLFFGVIKCQKQK